MQWGQRILILFSIPFIAACSSGGPTSETIPHAADRGAAQSSASPTGGPRAPGTPARAAHLVGSPGQLLAHRQPVRDEDLPASRLRQTEADLSEVRTPPGVALTAGYDPAGRLLVWVSAVPSRTGDIRPAAPEAVLATVAQVFAQVPDVAGVWTVRAATPGLELAYYSRRVFSAGELPPFSGDLEPFVMQDGTTPATIRWLLPEFKPTGSQIQQQLRQQLRVLFDDRLVAAEVETAPQGGLTARVTLRDLPLGPPTAAMEEWARTGVTVTGRFHAHGVSLSDLRWVNSQGRLLLRTAFPHDSYVTWWKMGMRPGLWVKFGVSGTAKEKVKTEESLQSDRTSLSQPWWQTTVSLGPAFAALDRNAGWTGAVPLFVGQRGRETTALLWLEVTPETSHEEVWQRQMQTALHAMGAPLTEVWVLAGDGRRAFAARLDRMAYDAIAYPDPELPSVTPDLWPYVAALYAEAAGAR